MTNVISLKTVQSSDVFPAESELYFPVGQRVAGWMRADGGFEQDPNGKYIVTSKDNKPVTLSYVGKNYNVVKNKELFPHVEHHMVDMFPRHMLNNVDVKEHMSYGGRDCWKEYVFNDVKCDIRGGGNVGFRLIVGNSYGSKAVSLICGAIDFFCTNGMIIGTHERTARKHTSGFSVTGLDDWISGSVKLFTSHTEKLQEWSDIVIEDSVGPALFEELQNRSILSERRTEALMHSMWQEARDRRGNVSKATMWDLYSALTAEATHFTPRDTGNDHEANTRIEKQRQVARVINAAEQFVRNAA